MMVGAMIVCRDWVKIVGCDLFQDDWFFGWMVAFDSKLVSCVV